MRLSAIEYSLMLECSDFLEESKGTPLYKYFPNSYPNQVKNKIRLKSDKVEHFQYFDNVLCQKDVLNKSLVAVTSSERADIGYTPYYIFIPDEYKYMYKTHEKVLEPKDMLEELKMASQESSAIFEDLLKYSYNFENLFTGIENSDTIVFYDIQYYYGIRADIPYLDLMEKLWLSSR